MTGTATHEQYMDMALALAGQGFPAPNPRVGAVIVKNGDVIGTGFHAYAGGDHAETVALKEAGDKARGATLYVTLEPCSHYGRTPPCANAVIKAGISVVVAAVQDPNPQVAGKGFDLLRKEGITVITGVRDLLAAKINEIFFYFQRTRLPFITLKSAMTMDGKIAAPSGDSKWITGESARTEAHRLRAEHHAVLVGAGTVLKDNPQLNVRHAAATNQPIKIVLCGGRKLPPSAKLFQEGKTIIVASANSEYATALQDEYPNADIMICPSRGCGGSSLDLHVLLKMLGERGITGILVEGGGETTAQFIHQRAFNKVAFFYAPKLLGGRNSITAVEGSDPQSVADALRIKDISITMLGDDWLITGYSD